MHLQPIHLSQVMLGAQGDERAPAIQQGCLHGPDPKGWMAINISLKTLLSQHLHVWDLILTQQTSHRPLGWAL